MIKAPSQTPLQERIAKDTTGAALGTIVGVLVSKAAKSRASAPLLGAGALAGVSLSEVLTAAAKEKARGRSVVPPAWRKRVEQGPPSPTKVQTGVVAAGIARTGTAQLPVEGFDPGEGGHPLDLLGIKRLPENYRGWLHSLLNHGHTCMHAFEQDLVRSLDDKGGALLSKRVEFPPPTAAHLWRGLMGWWSPGTYSSEKDLKTGKVKTGYWAKRFPGGAYADLGFNDELKGKRLAELVRLSVQRGAQVYDEFSFARDYTSVPWDNRKGVVPKQPPSWYSGSLAGYYAHLTDYYKTGAWLVWAAEMWRLHASKPGMVPGPNSYDYGEAPGWWRRHCLSWGVGCATSVRQGYGSWRGWARGDLYLSTQAAGMAEGTPYWNELYKDPNSGTYGRWRNVIAHGFAGSVEDMLKMVQIHTPPPGSIPTGTELTPPGTAKRLLEWPVDLGFICPGFEVPSTTYKYINKSIDQQRKADQYRLMHNSGLMFAFNLCQLVVSAVFSAGAGGAATIPASLATCAISQGAQLAMRYIPIGSAKGKEEFAAVTSSIFALFGGGKNAMGEVKSYLTDTLNKTVAEGKEIFMNNALRLQGMLKTDGRGNPIPLSAQTCWPYAAHLFDNVTAYWDNEPGSKAFIAARKRLDGMLKAGVDWKV